MTETMYKEKSEPRKRKPGDEDDRVSLHWGHCKRSRMPKLSATQVIRRPSALVYSPDAEISKLDTEISCIDRQSPSVDIDVKTSIVVEKNVKRSPHRNGQTKRRTELESLQDKPVMFGQFKLEMAKWPKLLISLSHKEKEDDFMLIKGSRLPQRPKRRAKQVEKILSYVSPGAWLCEVTMDRYEVREKKCHRRKPAGLKAMETLDSDSE